jgi:hypothetical protein
LDLVTNAMYATLKKTISRNLNEAPGKPAANAPAPPAPAK